MNSEKFIEVLKEEVIDSSVDIMKALMGDPPGRSPDKAIVEMSNWYKSLAEDDKKMMLKVLHECATTAVFEFLCILDGVKAIENEDKGRLRLYYERRDEKILLNSNFGLHEML